MPKVVKFGGSSLASAAQFQKAGEIIRSEKSRKYVVPSAPGKQDSKDIKITDMLYLCYEKASSGRDYSEEWTFITSRYEEIISGLKSRYGRCGTWVKIFRFLSVLIIR